METGNFLLARKGVTVAERCLGSLPNTCSTLVQNMLHLRDHFAH